MSSSLRETLHTLAAHPTDQLDLTALRRGVRRRRRIRAGGVVLALLVIGSGGWSAVTLLRPGSSQVRFADRPPVVSQPDRRQPSPTEPSRATEPGPAASPGAWVDLPDLPGGRRSYAELVWTGSEVLVWGGDRGGETRTDGAAYDPDAGSWRAVPAAPIAGRYGAALVWTGSEVVVWGGVAGSRTFADGAAWNPRTNRWRLLAEAPLRPRDNAAATWTGSHLFVWGGAPTQRPDPDDECPPIPARADGALYDPARDSWTRLADAPEARSGARAITAGDAVVVWGGSRARESVFCDHPEAGEALMYTPATDSWGRLPEAPIAAGETVALWIGGQLLVVGRDRYGEESQPGARYRPESDLSSGEWEPLAKTPRDVLIGGVGDAAWTGDEVLMLSAEFHSAAAYDPALDAWRALPPSPVSDPVTAVWTGTQLILQDWQGRAAALTPPDRS